MLIKLRVLSIELPRVGLAKTILAIIPTHKDHWFRVSVTRSVPKSLHSLDFMKNSEFVGSQEILQ